jgi:putative FmdB family regulatory protein
MPTYAYACDACGFEFELEQRIVDQPTKECLECHKPAARRMISKTTFALKGGSWASSNYGLKDKG